MEKIIFSQQQSHINGNFEWERAPSCCDQFLQALEDDFIFTANVTPDGVRSQFYIMPLTSKGELADRDGIQIHFCPWCGEKLNARKKYPLD